VRPANLLIFVHLLNTPLNVGRTNSMVNFKNNIDIIEQKMNNRKKNSISLVVHIVLSEQFLRASSSDQEMALREIYIFFPLKRYMRKTINLLLLNIYIDQINKEKKKDNYIESPPNKQQISLLIVNFRCVLNPQMAIVMKWFVFVRN
jgi:hypothetical protein